MGDIKQGSKLKQYDTLTHQRPPSHTLITASTPLQTTLRNTGHRADADVDVATGRGWSK